MAQNTIPKNRGQISGLGEKMKAGLTALGVTLGITQITVASFGALLAAFNAALAVYNSARSSRQLAYNVFYSKEDDLFNWSGIVRGILTGDFGDRWNTMWAQAGFAQPSTAIPRQLQDRIAFSLKLVQFFTANPSYEVASMNITAARGTAVRSAIITAQDSLQTASMDLKTALVDLRDAQQVLVGAMRFLIRILSGTLENNDPRDRLGDPAGMRCHPVGDALWFPPQDHRCR